MALKAAQVESALSGYLDFSGLPLASGKLYTYEAGTTTPATMWQDQDKNTAHANPIILDSQGQRLIYGDGVYKFVLRDSNDALIDTWDNLQYFFVASGLTTAEVIQAVDGDGLSIQDDAGNTGITLKDGGNIGIKLDTNPQTALGVADSDATAYASTISVSPVLSDVVRIRNTSSSAEWVGIMMEANSGNPGIVRLITKKDSNNETSFYIQLRDSSSSTVTTQQFALTSEGDLTIGGDLTINNSITLGNLRISGNTIESLSGDVNITPATGNDVVIDGHWEFDGPTLNMLTDNHTVITAYSGKRIEIEGVYLDGQVVSNVTNLAMSGILDLGTNTISDGAMSGSWAFNTSTLFVDASNNRIGIGTASPSFILDILGSTPVLQLKSSDDSTSSIIIDSGNSNDAFITFKDAGTATWTLGHDASASNGFTLSASGALGTSNILTVTSAGVFNLQDGSLQNVNDLRANNYIQLYNPTNDGNPYIIVGASDAERLLVQSLYDSAGQTLNYVLFKTFAASGTANKGLFRFSVDETDILDINDSGLTIGTRALYMGSLISPSGDITITPATGTVDFSSSGDITLKSSSGGILINPKAGDDVVIDSHFSFDGAALLALTDNDTIITAYSGKNITIEGVTFDGGVVGLTTLNVTSIDLGTNTISDGVMTGSWNFDSGTFYIDSSANRVGVGVTTMNNKFEVAGNMVIGASYANSVTAQSNGLSVQGKILSGGGSSPTSTFAFGVGHIQAENDVYAVIGAVTHNNSSGNYSVMNFIKSRGTQASSTTVANNDVIGSLAFSGYDGTSYLICAEINAVVNGTVGTNDMPGSLQFKVALDGAASTTTRMTLINSGNLGIGVTAPLNRLDISGAAVVGSSYAGVSTAPTDGLLIQGTVGIGTASPATKLDVHGTIRSTSSVDGSDTLLELKTADGALVSDQEMRIDFLQSAVLSRIASYSNGSTKSGIKLYSYSGGLNSTAGITLTGDNTVGIGISTPDAVLHAFLASAGSVSATSDSVIVAENSGNVDIQLLSGNTGVQAINFGDVDDNDIARILYNHSSNYMTFTVNAGEKARIDSSGRVGIGATTLSEMLHVAGATDPTILIHNTTGANNETASIDFGFNSATSSPFVGGRLQFKILDRASGSEDGHFLLRLAGNGALRDILTVEYLGPDFLTSFAEPVTMSDTLSVIGATTIDYNGTNSSQTALRVIDTRLFSSSATELHTLSIVPDYDPQASETLTRHNYINFGNNTGSIAITNVSAFRFDANLGTHQATTASDKTANSKVGTIKVNVNGTIRHIQLYAD